MRLKRFFFLLAVIIAPAAFAQSDSFSIHLPSGFGEFTKSSHNSQSKDGTIETSTFLSKDPKGNAVVVTVSKFPKRVLAPVKLLDSNRDGLVKSTGSTLDSEETVSTNPVTRQIMMHSKDAWVRARLISKGDMLYQVIFIGRSADAPTAGPVSQMFEGFQPK